MKGRRRETQDFTLEDRYSAQRGAVVMSGNQTLARLALSGDDWISAISPAKEHTR